MQTEASIAAQSVPAIAVQELGYAFDIDTAEFEPRLLACRAVIGKSGRR